MFYIVDTNNSFIRSHPRWGSPMGCHMDDPRSYAETFRTEALAREMLYYWQRNNNFDGRVIDRKEALTIDE